MLRSKYGSMGLGFLVVFAVGLVWSAPAVQAATTVQYIQLGDTTTGDIASPGDSVDLRFNAVQGTRVSLAVSALRSSTLVPTVALKDDSGAVIDLGGALRLNGRRARVRNFRIPASGSYAFEIGGSSGTGAFRASTRGNLPNKVAVTTLSGTVVNELTGDGIAGAAVAIGPFLVVTDAAGDYSEQLPTGDYAVTFVATYFAPRTESVTLLERVDSELDVALTPLAPVIVSASVAGNAVPGASLTATGEVVILDGSAIQSFSWTQANSVMVTIENADTDTATVILPAADVFKQQLITVLEEPPVTADELPPNVPLPEGEFPGGLPDRFQVVGINPFALEEAGHVSLKFEVTTTSGTYDDVADVHTSLPWKPTLGVRDVPIGIPVLLHGREQMSYNWALVTRPGSSTAVLVDDASDSPEFTPDAAGLYEVSVTDDDTGLPLILEIYAGTWRGIIVAQDANGRPVAEGLCTSCHNGFVAADKFTPWAQTGHAEIFTNNLNTSTHYGPNCFGCHTVGFDPGVSNGGSDDASDYDAFLAGGLLNNPGDNWTTMLAQYPDTAQLANIQCENCHGPQSADPGFDNPAHGFGVPLDEPRPRTSLSSDVCAFCHGEPLRHARFQQWQLSGHANYELAVDEGDSGNCSRCHTANGFLDWLPILLGDAPGDPTASIPVGWTLDEVHPQTCATCHDPHAIGTTSGSDTNATVRISGSTPPLIAGFTAIGVGRGAVCMTCHNSRRGLRNDENFGDVFGTAEAARAPHGSAQTDVLMGENAYFVNVGIRGKHSLIEDTCVNCHMEQTPPPDVLSYNQGGTNHTFFASDDICSACHGPGFTAVGVQMATDAGLEDLQVLVEEALLQLMSDLIALGNVIDLNGQATIANAADILGIEFGEFRGRQSMTVDLAGVGPVGPVRMNDVDVLLLGVVIGQLYDFADPVLIKAGWNWNLVHNDSSRGVHNPEFALQALDAARDALVALLTAP